MSGKPFGIIYLATNRITGKYYVGQTRRTLKDRWWRHCNEKRVCRALAASIKKHGPEAFFVETVFQCSNAEELNWLETECIVALMSHHRANGYNLNTGGGVRSPSEDSRQRMSQAQKGRAVSAESRRKMSEARTGNKYGPHSPEHRRKIGDAGKGKHGSLKGKPLSAEHCRKIGEASKGRTYSTETLRRMSEAKKGKPLKVLRKTRPLSAEHRRKLSEALKGRKQPKSLEHRRKLSVAQSGKQLSAETRRKMSEAQKGRAKTPEHRLKLARANKARTGERHTEEARRKMSETRKVRSAQLHLP